MRDKVQEVIDKIRPSLVGTDVVLIDISGGVVRLKVFTSSCGAPGPSKEMAISILEEQLKEEVPEIEEVVAE